MKTKLLNNKNFAVIPIDAFTAVKNSVGSDAATARNLAAVAKVAGLPVDKKKNVSTTPGLTVSRTKNTTAETIVISRSCTAATDFKNFANSLSKATTGTYKFFGGKTHHVTHVYWNDSANRTALSGFIASKLSQYNDKWDQVSGQYLYLADTDGNRREQARKNLANWCNFLKKAYSEFSKLPELQTEEPDGITYYITNGFQQIRVDIPFSAELATEQYANRKIKDAVDNAQQEPESDPADNSKIAKTAAMAFAGLFVLLAIVKLVKKRKK